MSVEKKPFAVVVEDRPGTGFWCLHVDGREVFRMASSNREDMQARADAFNAAVEQREAKLRGAAEALISAAYNLMVASESHRDRRIVVDVAIGSMRSALDGTGPDYVPAERLRAVEAERDAWKAQSQKTWGALFEQLAETNAKPTDLALALCAELGLVETATDETLIEELKRRAIRYHETGKGSAWEQRVWQTSHSQAELRVFQFDRAAPACARVATIPAGPTLNCHLPLGHVGDHRGIVDGRCRHWRLGDHGLAWWDEPAAATPHPSP
jgi:hypothetical protein